MIVQITWPLGGPMIFLTDGGFCLSLSHLENTTLSSMWRGEGGLGALSAGTLRALERALLVPAAVSSVSSSPVAAPTFKGRGV